MYFQCEGKKIHIVTSDNNDRQFYGAMRDVEKQVNMDIFCIIHKSYIVNVNYVAEFHIDEVIMTTNVALPISQPMRKKVRKRVLEGNILRRQ